MAIKPLPPKLAKQARANSVKQLCDLYNIVIGVALSIAIYGIIDTTQTPIPFKTNNAFSFLVFIIIIIPFYHGAVRHLYITYVETGQSSRIKSYALFLDYIILFFEGGLFVALALVLNTLPSF